MKNIKNLLKLNKNINKNTEVLEDYDLIFNEVNTKINFKNENGTNNLINMNLR